MHIKKSTGFLHLAFPPAALPHWCTMGEPGTGQAAAGRSHYQALALATLHSSLRCSEPGLLLLFRNFCSTQLTGTAAISPITGLQKLPGISAGGRRGRGTAVVSAKREMPGYPARHTGLAATLGIYLPNLSSLCREETLLMWVKSLTMCCCCLLYGEKGHFHSCT